MDNQSLSDTLAAVAVALLLILTAWGSAVAMLVIALLGLVASVILFQKRITHHGILSAMLGCVLAIAVSLIMLWA